MNEDLLGLQREMDDAGIIFCFRGAITQDIIISLGDALKKQVEFRKANMRTNMRVFSAFIELVQNIDRYSAEREPLSQDKSVSYGIIVIGNKDESFFLRCGNIIDRSRQLELDALLTRLEGMDHQELKAFFREQRRKDPPDDSRGAGLGFIELARNSESMRHSFTPLNDTETFFSVAVSI
jgi:hypothetical protein